MDTPFTNFVTSLFKTNNVDDLINDLKADSSVASVQPNFVYTVLETPNDPDYDLQWGHDYIQSVGGWDIEHGNENIIIAIIFIPGPCTAVIVFWSVSNSFP